MTLQSKARSVVAMDTRADLLRRCGRRSDAILEYEQAISITDNPAEPLLLRRRLDELRTTPTVLNPQGRGSHPVDYMHHLR